MVTVCRRAAFLLSCLALAAASTNGDAAPLDEGVLAAGDECNAKAVDESCAVNALQIRGAARRADSDVQEQSVEGSIAGQASTANQTGNSSWGSCILYGCGRYHRGYPCQCSPSCKTYGNCCWDFPTTCPMYNRPAPSPSAAWGRYSAGGSSDGGVMTLYHQTSPGACASILKTNFRIGAGGWCGKGIYFATSPQATRTKAIAKSSGAGCMLEVKVNLGKVKRFPCCKHCHGYSEASLEREGFNSVQFNPGDGDEYIVYNNQRIISIREIHFDRHWTAHPGR